MADANENMDTSDNEKQAESSNHATSTDNKKEPSIEGNVNTSAIARERFLRFLLLAEKKECDFRLYENTLVKGTYEGCDVEFSKIGVSGLQTPIAVYENACIRTGDVLTMTFDVDSW